MMMKVKFTQFFDISSDATKFSTFTVTAGGDYVKARCLPQFMCYKYFKLGRVSVKLVPASTLPVDPTGLSYETGDTTVDPRDMFNPGLVRITNGEYVGQIGKMEEYYSTLLDPRWYKFQLQQGFQRSAVPLVFNIGEIAQDTIPFNGSLNVGDLATNNPINFFQRSSSPSDWTQKSTTDISQDDITRMIVQRSPIQTGRIKLGWMPTSTVLIQNDQADYNPRPNNLTIVPEVDLMTFILPKAFKTKFYYRVFVESTVYFKDPIAVNPVWVSVPNNVKPAVCQPMDVPKWAIGYSRTEVGESGLAQGPELDYRYFPNSIPGDGGADDLP